MKYKTGTIDDLTECRLMNLQKYDIVKIKDSTFFENFTDNKKEKFYRALEFCKIEIDNILFYQVGNQDDQYLVIEKEGKVLKIEKKSQNEISDRVTEIK